MCAQHWDNSERVDEAFWGALGQVVLNEPWQKDCLVYAGVFVFACITNVYIHMGPLFASALQWKPQQCYRLGGGGTAASYTLPFIFSVFPLRLRAFDQSKVMFVSFAACVAITAVGELACLGGEKILALYLKQPKDKRSMAQFKPWIGGKSSQNIVGDYEQEIYA